jgi:hypothetical protein
MKLRYSGGNDVTCCILPTSFHRRAMRGWGRALFETDPVLPAGFAALLAWAYETSTLDEPDEKGARRGAHRITALIIKGRMGDCYKRIMGCIHDRIMGWVC